MYEMKSILNLFFDDVNIETSLLFILLIQPSNASKQISFEPIQNIDVVYNEDHFRQLKPKKVPIFI